MQTWKQTFKAADGSILSGAKVNIYLAGTIVPVRVFDTNNVLHDAAPQLATDADGFIEFSIDEDDYSTGQLFDIKITSQYLCLVKEDVDLKSIKLLQDTEGNLSFKNTFIQATEPTGTTIRNGDLWFDTDDQSIFVYTDTGWVTAAGAGADGTDGVDGDPGADGVNAYVHYAYATSSDGSVGFS